jgi:RNA polymerase-binding protein DksA
MQATITRNQTGIDKLESQRSEVLQEMENLRLELRNTAERSADEADVDTYEREKTWALVMRLEHKLESIDRALRNAKAGKYGICEDCGERIDPARLEVLPDATLCLDCQRKVERHNSRRRF